MTKETRPGVEPPLSWLTAYGRVRWWAGAFAAWTLLGVLVAAHYEVRQPGSPLATLADIVPYYWAWLPLTPFVVGLAGRLGTPGRPSWRGVAVVAGGGVAAVVMHIAFYAVAYALVTGSPGALPGMLAGTLVRHGLGDAATCAVLVGLVSAVRQHQRAIAREREAGAAALRASRLEAQLSEVRLAALRMQLQPHFLFNALNTVSVLVLKGSGDAAIRAVRQLADLLRVTLHACDTSELSLGEEAEFAMRYLQLEQLRFGDRLRAEVVVEPGLEDALVPSLILQPLVENAVMHGLRARASGGCVRVSARREDGMLLLEVADDGAGLGAAGTTSGTGLGLANTRARLRERYGDAARLTVRPLASGGTGAVIALPYREPGSGP